MEAEMGRRVGIIGVTETRCEATNRRDSTYDLVFDVTSRALRDAGIEQSDIDTVVMAESDQVDGRVIGAMAMALPAHAYGKDEIRVEDDGASAVALAYMRCLSGHFDTAVIVSWSMCSQTDLDVLTGYAFDPFYHRPLGLNWKTAHGVQAMAYTRKYGITEKQAAKVTVKNRSNAVNNENAHLRQEIAIEDVLGSPYVSIPLRKLNLPPYSDGACAIVIATEEKAKQSGRPIAWINGVGWSNSTYYMGDRDLSRLSSLGQAAKKAYSMAGIGDPFKEIDVAELYDVTSYHELMEYEALGFCREGEAGRLIDSGATAMGGELPVNPSGGMLSSNPYVAVGLLRVAEAALQVTNRAHNRQVPGAKTALAHGLSGICGQSNTVVILGN
jgi:acetyl-CoA C-acetyltransferase